MREHELRILRSIANELRALREQIQSERDGCQVDTDARNDKLVQSLPVEITHGPDLDPARSEYYAAENKERKSLWGKRKPWVETGGVVIAFALAVFNLFALLEIQKQSPNIASAAKTAAKQLEMAERPWVSAEFSVVSPLVFTNDGGRVTIRASIKNSGHSPAMAGDYEGGLFVPFLKTPDVLQIRDKICQEAEHSSMLPHNRLFHSTWFPGEQIPIDESLPISRDEIHRGLVDTPHSLFPEHPPRPKELYPVLVVCIAYRSNFNDTQYVSGYTLDLLRNDRPDGQIEPDGSIPADHLILQRSYSTGPLIK